MIKSRSQGVGRMKCSAGAFPVWPMKTNWSVIFNILEIGLTEITLDPHGDRSQGSCCAHPADISVDMPYVTRSTRNTAHRTNRSDGQQTPGGTGLGQPPIYDNRNR